MGCLTCNGYMGMKRLMFSRWQESLWLQDPSECGIESRFTFRFEKTLSPGKETYILRRFPLILEPDLISLLTPWKCSCIFTFFSNFPRNSSWREERVKSVWNSPRNFERAPFPILAPRAFVLAGFLVAQKAAKVKIFVLSQFSRKKKRPDTTF